MKRGLVFCSMVLMLVFGNAIAAKTKYRVFRPEGADKYEFLKSGEKKYKYFVLEQNQMMDLKVTGPTKARIRVRPALEGEVKSADFEIQIWEGDKLVAGRKANSGISTLRTDTGGGNIGLSRDIFFKVPKGMHAFKVKIVSSSVKKSYLRFYQEKKKIKPKYANFKPAKFDKTVKLKSKKSDITYYLADEKGGVELSVIGPANVHIYCRANFDQNIKEKSKFGLGVFENGETVQNFTGIAKKSTEAVYIDRMELIPSTLHKYTLKVPSGRHYYTFRKINSAAPTLSLRFRMEENSLGKKN